MSLSCFSLPPSSRPWLTLSHTHRNTYKEYDELVAKTCARLYGSLDAFSNAFRAADVTGSGQLTVAECTAILQVRER